MEEELKNALDQDFEDDIDDVEYEEDQELRLDNISSFEVNENDIHKFTFITENDERIECEILLSFYLKDTDRSYIYFTDNTRNENGKLNVYVYYVEITDNGEEFVQVTDPSEYEMLEKVYKNAVEGVRKNG